MNDRLKFILVPHGIEACIYAGLGIIGAIGGGAKDAAALSGAAYGSLTLIKGISSLIGYDTDFSVVRKKFNSSDNILAHSLDKILMEDIGNFYNNYLKKSLT